MQIGTHSKEESLDTIAEKAARERMIALCTQALDTDLSFDELVAEFPHGAPANEYLAIVYEDLVDGVEHLPAELFGKTDFPAWKASEMYAALTLHLLLLSGPEELRELPCLYRHIRTRDPISVEALPQLLEQAREVTSRRSSA